LICYNPKSGFADIRNGPANKPWKNIPVKGYSSDREKIASAIEAIFSLSLE
jgi:hypothetical protein